MTIKALVRINDKRAIEPLKNFPSIIEKEIREAVDEERLTQWNPLKVAEFEKELRKKNKELIDISKRAAIKLETGR